MSVKVLNTLKLVLHPTLKSKSVMKDRENVLYNTHQNLKQLSEDEMTRSTPKLTLKLASEE